MKSILIASAAAAALAVASAQAPPNSLFFTQPVGGSVWKAGENTVAWNNECTWAKGNTTFPISLYQQNPASGLQVPVPNVGSIGSLDCSESGSTKVTIPATIPSGAQYSILVTIGADQSWSALFTIQGSGPVPPVNITTSAALPTTTVAAATTRATSATSAAATRTATTAPSPTPTGAASSVKAGSAMALAVVAAIGALVL